VREKEREKQKRRSPVTFVSKAGATTFPTMPSGAYHSQFNEPQSKGQPIMDRNMRYIGNIPLLPIRTSKFKGPAPVMPQGTLSALPRLKILEIFSNQIFSAFFQIFSNFFSSRTLNGVTPQERRTSLMRR
jgi:hypothetical protein